MLRNASRPAAVLAAHPTEDQDEHHEHADCILAGVGAL